MVKDPDKRPRLLRGPMEAVRAVRERRRVRQERSRLRRGVLWPFRILVDALWDVVDAVFVVILMLVIVVMAPIWLVGTFLG
jgi:hypothetical protein